MTTRITDLSASVDARRADSKHGLAVMMTLQRPIWAVVVGAAVLLIGVIEPGSAQSIKLSAADQAFVRDTARSDGAEVVEAKFALANSRRADIKNFAASLLEERTASDAELGTIASANGVDMPPATARDRADSARLSHVYGDAFDRRYLADTEVALRDDVERTTRESRTGANPSVQYFSNKRLPRLLDEQRLFEQIAVGSTVGVEPPSAPLGWQYQPPPSH